jgi:GalNAc-alpha-(1->4)-GalNAc-alpha-(1->3)-diNAcBac-PP-undecaprenol alpha-1,4-N-acetyl-D-galactosaminyltransferase
VAIGLTVRILQCIPSMAGGGAERQLAYLCGELQTLGHDVHVAIGSPGVNFARLASSGARVHHIGSGSNHDVRLLYRLIRVIQRVKPDLVHTWLTQMDIMGGLAARITGVPWVCSERCGPAAYPTNVKNRLRRRLGRHASAVIANSEVGEAFWRDILPTATPRFMIPNGVPLDEIAATPPIAIAGGQDVALLLFAGRLADQKNPNAVIEALTRLAPDPAWSALLFGEGPLGSRIDSDIDRAGLAGRIHRLGFTPNLWGWMKRATVFISPSLFEGHPNTVLEAMAAGCPLIVSDIPEHRSFLDSTMAELVDPMQPALLASAIERVLSGAVERRVRAARARAVAARFSTIETARRHAGAYDAVARHCQSMHRRGDR